MGKGQKKSSRLAIGVVLGVVATLTVSVTAPPSGAEPTVSGPVAVLSANPNSGHSPLAVVFDESGTDGSGTIVSWDLAFGDYTPDAQGTGQIPPTVSHTYNGIGKFVATLTLTDDQGSIGTASVVVTTPDIGPRPVLSETPYVGRAPLSASFDGSHSSDGSGTLASWALAFGDGSAPAGGTGAPPSPTATHVYAQARNYSAVLTLTDSNGKKAATTATVVVTSPNCQLKWSQTATVVTTGETSLSSVSAVSQSDVWAVGAHVTTQMQTLAEQWNGSTWATVPTPDVPSADNMLNGVSMDGANDGVGGRFLPRRGITFHPGGALGRHSLEHRGDPQPRGGQQLVDGCGRRFPN